MRALLQRVLESKLEIEGNEYSKIKRGFLVLLGVTHEDTEEDMKVLAEKICKLRVFEDENEKMNLSLKDVGGKLLIISQFTLYADSMSSGNRPSFINAARPEKAEPLYEYFLKKCEAEGIEVQKGIFGADMKVSLVNDGPVTIILEKENGN